jgi:cytochrome c-type biogenesis protein CcmE
MTSRRKLVIGALVILGCLGFVAYQGARSSLVYYLTPTEFAQKPELRGARVRVAGRVVPGSAERADGGAGFSITDGVTRYRVRFTGALPDLFAEGREVLVEGRLDAAGVLVASQVITTHPVEYIEQHPERVRP